MGISDGSDGEIEAIVEVAIWTSSEPEEGVGEEPVSSASPVVISREEAQLLARILRSYLGDLRMEIVDTDNPAFRRDLRAEEAQLRALLERLPAP